MIKLTLTDTNATNVWIAKAHIIWIQKYGQGSMVCYAPGSKDDGDMFYVVLEQPDYIAGTF